MKSIQNQSITSIASAESQKPPTTVFTACVSYVTYKKTVFKEAESLENSQNDQEKIQTSPVTM